MLNWDILRSCNARSSAKGKALVYIPIFGAQWLSNDMEDRRNVPGLESVKTQVLRKGCAEEERLETFVSHFPLVTCE